MEVGLDLASPLVKTWYLDFSLVIKKHSCARKKITPDFASLLVCTGDPFLLVSRIQFVHAFSRAFRLVTWELS